MLKECDLLHEFKMHLVKINDEIYSYIQKLYFDHGDKKTKTTHSSWGRLDDNKTFYPNGFFRFLKMLELEK